MALGSPEQHDEYYDISALLRYSQSHVPLWKKGFIDPLVYARETVTIEMFQLDAASAVIDALNNPAIHGVATSAREFASLVIISVPHLLAAYSINPILKGWADDEEGIFTQLCEHWVNATQGVKPLKSEVRTTSPDNDSY
jgi:hypothetical protein